MSGTSADGVDIAACEVNTSEHALKTHAAATFSYPPDLRRDLLRLSAAGSVELGELTILSLGLGRFYSDMIRQFINASQLQLSAIDLIGSHGQTIAHFGEPRHSGAYSGYATLQIGEAEIIAKETGIVTVSDFRSGDIAVGGAGAPLAPIYHALRFVEAGECRAIVNIGGIANVTLLRRGGEVSGSDCGPGNCLLDDFMQKHTDREFDRGGKIASKGEVQGKLLEHFLASPLFSRRLPRSHDRAEWLRLLSEANIVAELNELKLEDAMATLSMLTAISIRNTIAALAGNDQPLLVLACGGGALNEHLMKQLADLLAPARLESTAAYGSDPEFVEAEAFAYFANMTLDAQPANLPNITGAKRPALLGKISQP
jgi:anhydro-N-acetylmuramic acid kinase